MPAADVVFLGGRVFAADPVRRFATALAVRDGRIAALGHERDVRDLVGPLTRTVDLAGGLLLPGFQDAHAHPVQGGLERMCCDLSAYSTKEDYLAAVARYAAAHPEVEWVTGGGWSMSAFDAGGPRASELDAVVRDRPVLLPNRDHHGAWVNSRALQLAGLDARTPDPADGRIERDRDGFPSGTLHEGAMDLVATLLPLPSPGEQRAGLLEAQQYLHSLGITGWQDAILGAYAGHGDASAAYRSAADSGELTARVVGALWWERDRGVEQIPELVERRQRLTGGRLRATSVKIMQDGIAENFTAGMLEPYLDAAGDPTSNAGLSFVPPDVLRECVTALDAEDFQVHVHAIGDRAVREALDAFESALAANGPHDRRHHIAHIQVIHPDDVGRFRRLGVAANMQALWAANEPQMTELTIPFLGKRRASWQYPFADLLRSGATLAAGSDWPVSSPDPLAAISVAVNRVLPEQAGRAEPFLPEQRIDLASALTAYTAGSAYVNHLDDCGTLAVGQRADLAVLDRDPFAGPPDEIAAARVVATYVDGAEVFSR
jgi:predicted amidohydrolase YtcJ